MFMTFTAALLLSAPVVPVPTTADGDAPAAALELFAAASWYKDQKGDEKEFVGVLSKTPQPAKSVGFSRVNPFRLAMGEGLKPVVREVYVGDRPDYFTPYVGK